MNVWIYLHEPMNNLTRLALEKLLKGLNFTVTDCGVASTKKACKNCTCGRAEGQMEKLDLTPEMLENPQSGCGSVRPLYITSNDVMILSNIQADLHSNCQRSILSPREHANIYWPISARSVGLEMRFAVRVARIGVCPPLKEESELSCPMISWLPTPRF